MDLKKIIALCLALIIPACLMTACSKSDGEEASTAAEMLSIDIDGVTADAEKNTFKLTEITSEAASATAAVTTTAVTTTAVTTTAATTAAATNAAPTTAAPTTAAPTAAPTTAPRTTAVPRTTAAPTTAAPTANPAAFSSALESIRTSGSYVKKTALIDSLGGESAALNKQNVVGCAGAEGDATMYTFNGARVYTGTNGNDNVFQVDLTDSTFATANGTRVGDSVASAAARFGAPDFGDVNAPQGQLAYKGTGSYQTVISFSSGTVTGISIIANN